jgi:hypothetical protein
MNLGITFVSEVVVGRAVGAVGVRTVVATCMVVTVWPSAFVVIALSVYVVVDGVVT